MGSLSYSPKDCTTRYTYLSAWPYFRGAVEPWSSTVLSECLPDSPVVCPDKHELTSTIDMVYKRTHTHSAPPVKKSFPGPCPISITIFGIHTPLHLRQNLKRQVLLSRVIQDLGDLLVVQKEFIETLVDYQFLQFLDCQVEIDLDLLLYLQNWDDIETWFIVNKNLWGNFFLRGRSKKITNEKVQFWSLYKKDFHKNEYLSLGYH